MSQENSLAFISWLTLVFYGNKEAYCDVFAPISDGIWNCLKGLSSFVTSQRFKETRGIGSPALGYGMSRWICGWPGGANLGIRDSGTWESLKVAKAK